MLDLPRSVVLALWATAVAHGQARVDDALQHLVGADDEGHQLDGEGLPFSANPRGPGLADWLEQLPASLIGVRAVLLPAPGLLGLPARPEVLAALEEAGEGVVTMPEPATPTPGVSVLTPQVLEYGPAGDEGELVTWRSFHSESAPTISAGLGLDVAEQQLRTELATATTAFETLELAGGYSPPKVGRLEQLPPGTSPRVARTLASAAQVLLLAEAAEPIVDDATTSWEVLQARQTLRGLAATARQALMAATAPQGWA